jgi:CubicO group peptidase (beta-lactamase class C family)
MVLLISTIALTTAQNHTVDQPSTLSVNQQNVSINPEELENFTDQEIARELEESGVPGAAIVVVKDGAVLLAKAYGVMDKETNRPVIVNQTIFRVASVTKLFTWTAVMQLVEQGKVDLDVNVNDYLETFKIPDTYPKPITVANLMSHNAGFESDDTLGWVPSATELLPLADYVAKYVPARIRPPGEVPVYSNYGASLAGYIVEQVSGMPFDEYVQRNILEPLGMEHTTFHQPPPANLAEDVSKSYIFVNGVPQLFPLSSYMGTPAGGMFSAASDMAPFIIAHLQNGTYGNSRILQNDTTLRMHSQLFTVDPRIPGSAHGFQEYYINDQRIIGHFGALDAFYSSLMLIPQQNLGWFIVYNGDNSIASPGAFFIAFLNHYFPTEPYASPEPDADFSSRANQYTGYYRDARISHTTFNKLTSLSIEFEVTATQRGTLLFRGGEYVEIEPSFFKPYGSSDPWNSSLLFLRDSSGQAYFDGGDVYEKMPLFETSAFTWSLILVTSAFFISAPVVLLIREYTDRNKPENKTERLRPAKYTRWLSCIFSLLFMACVVGIRLAAGNLTVWYIVITAGFGGSALGIASIPLVALSWKRHYWSLPERMHHALTVLAALAFIWFLYNWNLLSFRVN